MFWNSNILLFRENDMHWTPTRHGIPVNSVNFAAVIVFYDQIYSFLCWAYSKLFLLYNNQILINKHVDFHIMCKSVKNGFEIPD